MKAFYKIEDNRAQAGSGYFIPEGFTEYEIGNEPKELVEALRSELEAQRVSLIKAKSGEIIYSRYSREKQSSAQLGIYGEEYLTEMKAFIANIIKQSNELESDKTKTYEDFVLGV